MSLALVNYARRSSLISLLLKSIIFLILQHVLKAENPLDIGFFEAGLGDSKGFQFLAWFYRIVCFGVKFCLSGFASNKSTLKKIIESD